MGFMRFRAFRRFGFRWFDSSVQGFRRFCSRFPNAEPHEPNRLNRLNPNLLNALNLMNSMNRRASASRASAPLELAYRDPGLGDEEPLVEVDRVAVGHPGEEVPRGGVEAFVLRESSRSR